MSDGDVKMNVVQCPDIQQMQGPFCPDNEGIGSLDEIHGI